ncbi:hypothetical protein B0H11DRAFT_1944868 [Mycena galericulata]|nr:hypothetical protein B0H11DRAFT_1944868 [Mycena galericulata]
MISGGETESEFPDSGHTTEIEQVYWGSQSDGFIVTKLAQDKIDAWRHKFAITGITALKTVVATNKEATAESIAEDVAFYLSGTDAECVFYYRAYEQDPETGEGKYKGIFQSYVCSRVFAVHCTATAVDGELGPKNFEPNLPSTYPVGVITLGIQAVRLIPSSMDNTGLEILTEEAQSHVILIFHIVDELIAADNVEHMLDVAFRIRNDDAAEHSPAHRRLFLTVVLPQQHQEALTGNQHNQQYYGHSLAHHRPVMHEPVITREENYPAAAAILTQIENKLAALQAEVDTTKQAAEAAKAVAHSVTQAQHAEHATDRKLMLKAKKKATQLQALVQSKTRWAIGIGSRDLGGKKHSLLPHPLKPGEEPEILDDKLCMERVENDNNTNSSAQYGDPSSVVVLRMAKAFFNSLRKTYAAQNTEEGARRNGKKKSLNKRRSRKHEKADDHRKAIPKFQEIHGEENTVGAYDVVQTDDMSSEHSDCGNVERTVFETHRRKVGGGEHGWEIRKKHWHSTWLNLYFAHLKTIRRNMVTDAQDLGISGSLGGKHRVPRFKGLRENESNEAPLLVRKKPLYKSMVSATWLAETGKTYEEVGAVEAPVHFTLFKLKLDTEGLNATEINYLADDEN